MVTNICSGTPIQHDRRWRDEDLPNYCLLSLTATVGIRKTLERVPELSAQLVRHALIRPRTVPA